MSRKYVANMPAQPAQLTANPQTATQQVTASQTQETPSKLAVGAGVGAVGGQTIPPVSSVGGQTIQAGALPRSVDKYSDIQVTLAGTTTLELISIERKFTGWN